jgi:SAM-dependent methyltransferase
MTLENEYLETHYRTWLPTNRHAPILDVGCGDGRLIQWLANLGYRWVGGIDLSPHNPCHLRADAFDYLPKIHEQYDCIFATDMIEHIFPQRIPEFLNLCYRALRPGGALILLTVNADSLNWGRIRYGDPTHQEAFTQESLSKLLRGAQFREIEFKETALPARLRLRRLIRWGFRLLYSLYRYGSCGDGIRARGAVLTEQMLVRVWRRA